MHKQVLLSTLLLSSAMLAQSPCQTITGAQRTFGTAHKTQYYTYTGLDPASTNGACSVMFDLVTNATITLDALQVALYDGATYFPTGGVNLVGYVPVTHVYVCPTTWSGNEQTVGNWTQYAATASPIGDYATGGNIETVTLNTPVVLTPGTYGVMVELEAIPGIPVTQNNVSVPWAPLHPLFRLNANTENGGTQFVYDDYIIKITNQGYQANSFINTGWIANTPNWMDIWMNVKYTPPAGAAFANNYGIGCWLDAPSFYQSFSSTPTPQWDLNNTTISFYPVGTQYAVTVTPGTPSWFTPTSASLCGAGNTSWQSSTSGSWDDAITNPIALPATWNGGLGFPFPKLDLVNPTQYVTQVEISSNGLIVLGHDTIGSPSYGYYDDLAKWTARRPSFAPAFGDLDPSVNNTWPVSSGYGMWYDYDSVTDAVYITFVTQDWQPNLGPSMTFQVMMDSTGYVEFRYQTLSQVGANILVGYSPGLGTLLPDAMDLSAQTAFLKPFSPTGEPRTTQTVDVRPIMGNPINFLVGGIRNGNIAGITTISFGALPVPGIPLDGLGMPACSLYIPSFDVQLPPFLTPTTAPVSVGVGVPTNMAFVGLQFGVQTIMICPNTLPGMNTAGLLASNGTCLTLSNF